MTDDDTRHVGRTHCMPCGHAWTEHTPDTGECGGTHNTGTPCGCGTHISIWRTWNKHRAANARVEASYLNRTR